MQNELSAYSGLVEDTFRANGTVVRWCIPGAADDGGDDAPPAAAARGLPSTARDNVGAGRGGGDRDGEESDGGRDRRLDGRRVHVEAVVLHGSIHAALDLDRGT